MLNSPAKSEVAASKGSEGDVVTRKCRHFTLESRSQKCCYFPLHHVICALTKFEVAMVTL